jgi:hypothetical protein
LIEVHKKVAGMKAGNARRAIKIREERLADMALQIENEQENARLQIMKVKAKMAEMERKQEQTHSEMKRE